MASVRVLFFQPSLRCHLLSSSSLVSNSESPGLVSEPAPVNHFGVSLVPSPGTLLVQSPLAAAHRRGASRGMEMSLVFLLNFTVSPRRNIELPRAPG
jgi:hypothetical protein